MSINQTPNLQTCKKYSICADELLKLPEKEQEDYLTKRRNDCSDECLYIYRELLSRGECQNLLKVIHPEEYCKLLNILSPPLKCDFYLSQSQLHLEPSELHKLYSDGSYSDQLFLRLCKEDQFKLLECMSDYERQLLFKGLENHYPEDMECLKNDNRFKYKLDWEMIAKIVARDSH